MSSRAPRQLSVRGNALQQFLRSGAAQGLSAESVLTALRNAGQGYRRTDFLRDYSIIRNVEQAHERLRFIPGDRRPDPSRLPVATTKTLRRYAVTVELRGFDTATGEQTTRHVTISSDNILTVDEYLDEAAELVSDPERYSSMEIERSSVISAVRSGELGTLL